MIELRLQMFGTGSSGGRGGAGGTETGQGSKSTSKQAVSSNAPGSGRGGGGRKMDGGVVPKKQEETQARTTRNRKPEGSKPSATRIPKTEYKTNVNAVADNERYDVYITKNGKEKLYKSNVKGSSIRKQMTYSKVRNAWTYKNTKFNVRRTKTK
jgi:hypothetical protein